MLPHEPQENYKVLHRTEFIPLPCVFYGNGVNSVLRRDAIDRLCTSPAMNPQGVDCAQSRGYPGLAAAYRQLDRGEHRSVPPSGTIGRRGTAARRDRTGELCAAQQQANVVEPATPNPLPTSKAEIEPAKPRQAAAVPVAENLQAEESNTSQPIDDTAQLKSTGLVPILGVRPMAPIVGTQPAVDSLGMPVDIDAVRRLPPVDPSVPTAADYQPGEMDKAATAYPATSTP